MEEIGMQSDWQKSKADIFWGEIAPCDHVVQIYEDDKVFIDVLAGFVGGGISAGDCVIVIASDAHLKALKHRLEGFGVNTDSFISNDQYIPLHAEETLSKFIVNGWPDENLFMELVSNLIKRARKNNRKVRAFGEMVAILWAQGHNGATVRLEYLWNKFCENEFFCLFCAYPKSGFTEDIHVSIGHICQAHSKMLGATDQPLTEVLYRRIDHKKVV